MRLRLAFLMILGAALSLAACQGPPPTVYVLVVTATPEATIEPAREATGTPQTQEDSTNASAATLTHTPSPTATETPVPTTPTPTEAVAAMPTETVAQIQVAEQRFQNGRMFWLQPTQQIWVLIETEDGSGIWTVHEDRFVEGDAEFDPDVIPPEDLFQPERGFGRLWRDNADLRDALGWGLEPEVGFVSQYQYTPGGEIIDEAFVPGPGTHVLTSFYGDTLRFNEINGTWQVIEAAAANGDA